MWVILKASSPSAAWCSLRFGWHCHRKSWNQLVFQCLEWCLLYRASRTILTKSISQVTLIHHATCQLVIICLHGWFSIWRAGCPWRMGTVPEWSLGPRSIPRAGIPSDFSKWMYATCCCKTNHSKICGLKQQPCVSWALSSADQQCRQVWLGGSCGCCLAPSWEHGELHASPLLFPWTDRDAQLSKRNRSMLK